MALQFTMLRALLVVEALLFVPGLPAWYRFAAASPATQAYLLCLGVFSGIAAGALIAGKPSWQVWAWAAAATNLPVFPLLTPVGIALAALLLASRLKRMPALSWPTWSRASLPWLGTLVFCWLGADQVHRFAEVTGLPFTPPILLFGGLLLAVPMCLLAHQLGHWWAGRISGLAWNTEWSGWADPQPAALENEHLSRRLFLWNLGGPLASLALGALLLAVFVSSPGSSWAAFGEMAGLAGLCSLATFAVSILPWRATGCRSDGAAIIALMQHGSELRRDRAIALIAGDWLRGTPPRNWNPEHLRLAASRPELARQHATACGFNYLYCLDHGFDSSARYWIGRMASEFAEERNAVPVRWKLEMAYFLAGCDYSGRVAEAPAWRRSAGAAHGVPSPVRLRADAALAVAQGHSSLAASLISAAEQATLRESERGLWELEWSLLGALRDRIAPVLFDRPATGSLQWSELILQRE